MTRNELITPEGKLRRAAWPKGPRPNGRLYWRCDPVIDKGRIIATRVCVRAVTPDGWLHSYTRFIDYRQVASLWNAGREFVRDEILEMQIYMHDNFGVLP